MNWLFFAVFLLNKTAVIVSCYFWIQFGCNLFKVKHSGEPPRNNLNVLGVYILVSINHLPSARYRKNVAFASTAFAKRNYHKVVANRRSHADIDLRRPFTCRQFFEDSIRLGHKKNSRIFARLITRDRYTNFEFRVLKQSIKNRSRCGIISTPHGNVETPNFVFCGTKATVKGITQKMLRDCGTQIQLANTYHMMNYPGGETVKALGGLQNFTGWKGPMLTDSGGYQIFSFSHGSVAQEIKSYRWQKKAKQLEKPAVPNMKKQCDELYDDALSTNFDPAVKIDEGGATFRSYYDKSKHRLTPENSIRMQRHLGADIILVLDECTPFFASESYTLLSMRRSHRWAIRSLEEFDKSDDNSQALYGIVQGGVYKRYRRESCQFVNNAPFFGAAIGGSLGKSKGVMRRVVEFTARRDRPIHLLGIGGISDIFEGVSQGIDTFDCVHPTRLARHGGALVMSRFWEEWSKGSFCNRIPQPHIYLDKTVFKDDEEPIDSTCGCYTCKTHSRGYIHYLLKAKEWVAGSLITIHNVYFMNRLMKAIRLAIVEDRLYEEKDLWVHKNCV